jgi:hypothetical protein
MCGRPPRTERPDLRAPDADHQEAAIGPDRRISHGSSLPDRDGLRRNVGTGPAQRVPEAQVSVKQKRHGEHDSVTVTVAEGFRSASYDLSIFIRSDVRPLMTSDAQHPGPVSEVWLWSSGWAALRAQVRIVQRTMFPARSRGSAACSGSDFS